MSGVHRHRLGTGCQLVGGGGEFELQPVDLSLEPVSFTGPMLHSSPFPLLNQLRQFEFKPDSMVCEAGIFHTVLLPTPPAADTHFS